MSKTIHRVGLLALLALTAGAVLATVAFAHEVKIVGGKTKLTLASRMSDAIEALDVKAKGTSYKAVGGTYSFHPLDEGGGGVIKNKGALELKGDGAKVKFKRFVIDLPPAHEHEKHGDEGVLMAKVGGKQIDVAHLDTKRYQVGDEEPSFTGLRAKLTKGAARLLNKSFDTDAFGEGLLLGTLDNQSKVKEIEEE